MIPPRRNLSHPLCQLRRDRDPRTLLASRSLGRHPRIRTHPPPSPTLRARPRRRSKRNSRLARPRRLKRGNNGSENKFFGGCLEGRFFVNVRLRHGSSVDSEQRGRTLSCHGQLLQFGVLRFGFLQDRYIGVTVFPEREKIPVGGERSSAGSVSCDSLISSRLQRICTRQSEVG